MDQIDIDKPINKGVAMFFTLLAFCIIAFIYNSDGFELYESGEGEVASAMKRLIQMCIAGPIVFGFMYCFYVNPMSLLNPLSIYILIKFLIDLITGQAAPFLLEGILLLFTLTIYYTFPPRHQLLSIKFFINVATFFAGLALVKVALMLVIPGLLNNPVIAWLGHSTEVVNIGPLGFGRSSSFAAEPSLNVLFFMMPAVMALAYYDSMRNPKFLILITFCALSFSGSVLLAFGVAIVSIVLLSVKFLDVRIVFPYLVLLALGVYISIIETISTSDLASNLDFSKTNAAFDKSVSFETRAVFTSFNLQTLLRNPLGIGYANNEVINIPNPILVTVGLSGGWISIVIYLYFLFKMSNRMNFFRKVNRASFKSTILLSLLIGALFNFIVFNDYLMINYTGIVAMMFMDELLKIKNKILR